jgi:hypothetical protein
MGTAPVAAALCTGLVAGTLGLVVGSGPAAAKVQPGPNPVIEQSCGLDLTVVLDASGSINSAHAVDDVREAADTLLDAMSGTSSTARVTQFGSVSEELAPRTLVDETSLANDGPLGEAVADYYSPIPPRPDDTTIYSYDGSGTPLSSQNQNVSNGSNQYTNWDQALHQAATDTGELVVFVTDGDPTAFDFDQSGDPFDPGPPPDVTVNTGRGNGEQVTRDRSIEEANGIKSQGSRMLAVGVGSALDNSESAQRLEQIAGPQVVRDDDLDDVDSLNEIDVALIRDFDDLAGFMRGLVLELCSPSLTVRKLAQSPTDASYRPAQGWPVTVTPRVPSGTGFTWILPDKTPGASKTDPTDADGFAQFQWEPIPPEADSVATVAEGTRAGYIAGHPTANDFRCELKNQDGDVEVVSGNFADPSAPAFVLDPIEQEIVTCTIWNSFNYAPQIALTKVNSPTELRGDLEPPAAVTATYVATNPGNAPLDNVTVVDDLCGPVVAVPATGQNTGDTGPANGLLDPGEAWRFQCTESVSVSLSTDPAGQTYVDTATVTGTDPRRVVVNATASDDVVAFTPAIELSKTVNGEDLVTITQGETASYAYEVTNAGNTPLGDVALVDDTPPCEEPTRGPDSPGDGNATLDVAETWTYSCDSQPDADVVNTADVTAVPLNPLQGNAPFAAPNPPVTDTDVAAVMVISPGVSLTKSVTPGLVLLGPGSPTPPEPVTYTIQAENTGTEPLARPDGQSSTGTPGWVVDARCLEPAVYSVGDTNGNDLLDPPETWTFTCAGQVTATTLNLATIEAQPTDEAGSPLPDVDPVTDLAVALVNVVRPGIEVTKTALRPTVLDPDARPVSGPDVPTPRLAEYRYEVSNTGNVPLHLSATPPVDDRCAPLTFVEGDTADPNLLDPEEVWVYTCETALGREDAATPPGNRSGVVDNRVTVTGVPVFGGGPVPSKSVSDSDTATVTVIEPRLTLTKTASPDVVRDGGTVTYEVVVANTGDAALSLAGPTDDTCEPLVFAGGDTNGNGELDGANSGQPEQWRYTCASVLSRPPAPATSVVNVATVTGTGPLGNSYRAQDSAEVRVVEPAIELTKAPDSTLVPTGTDVTYVFEVRNVGESDLPLEDVLSQVMLRDVARPSLPTCRAPTLVAKESGNQDDLLERTPPEVWRFSCTAPITEATTNIALVGAVGGTPVGLRFLVADFAVAFVQPFDPGLDVEKSADPTGLSSPGEVTYTYRVRNTGDVPLARVEQRITDDTCEPLRLVSGDRDGDGLLDTANSIFEDHGDETWVFTCTTNVSETTTNTVLVRGTPAGSGGELLCGPGTDAELLRQRCDVTARDSATVDVAAVAGTKSGAGLPGTGATGGPWRMLLVGQLLVATGAGLIAACRVARRPEGAPAGR